MEYANNNRAITIIMLLSLAAMLLPDISGRLLDQDPVKAQISQRVSLYLYGIFVAAIIAIILHHSKWIDIAQLYKNKLIFISLLSLALSTATNATQARPMLFFSAACLLLVWVIIPKYKIRPKPRVITYALSLVAATPIFIDLAFGPITNYYISESFRGYFDSRTSYAYVCGISIILIFLIKERLLVALLPLNLTGLAFSGSRTGMLALTVSLIMMAVLFYRRRMFHNAIYTILAIAWTWVASYIFASFDHWQSITDIRLISLFSDCPHSAGVCVGLFSDTGGRIEIYKAALQQAANNLLFGSGDFFQTVFVNKSKFEAHNSIIQSIINFGVFATIAWLFLLAKLFKNVPAPSQAILLFWFCFGMFEPGLDAFLFYPGTLLIMILAYSTWNRIYSPI